MQGINAMFSSLGLDDKHDEMIIGVRLKLRQFEFLVQSACGSIICFKMVLILTFKYLKLKKNT